MITEIPTPEDFRHAGLSLLNLAWDAVSSMYLDLENSQVEEWDEKGEATGEFWRSAQRPLANAVVVAQQGIEFLLKARIAEVTPLLLISTQPRDWPSRCDREDTAFAEFRTIDAQDLVKFHDAVHPQRLEDTFRTKFQRFRALRNSIMHTVDKRLWHSAHELCVQVLEASHALIGSYKWLELRRDYLQSIPVAAVYDEYEPTWQLSWEACLLLEILTHAEGTRYLGVQAKQRYYICYQCTVNLRDSDLQPKTAQLHPNGPASVRIYCFVCERDDAVVRRPCSEATCKGNVIQEEDSVCLSCFNEVAR
jgi:hypothetical protein